MGDNGKTKIGTFSIEKLDVSTGHITVYTDGVPVRKKIDLVSNVVDADNRFEGFYRWDGQIVLVVKPKYRNADDMKAIFCSFKSQIRAMLEQNPAIADDMLRTVHVTHPDVIDIRSVRVDA